jgi:hypothetical protein
MGRQNVVAEGDQVRYNLILNQADIWGCGGMVDALRSERSELMLVEVQVLSSPPLLGLGV